MIRVWGIRALKDVKTFMRNTLWSFWPNICYFKSHGHKHSNLGSFHLWFLITSARTLSIQRSYSISKLTCFCRAFNSLILMESHCLMPLAHYHHWLETHWLIRFQACLHWRVASGTLRRKLVSSGVWVSSPHILLLEKKLDGRTGKVAHS